jgi:hypothetical protein
MYAYLRYADSIDSVLKIFFLYIINWCF